MIEREMLTPGCIVVAVAWGAFLVATARRQVRAEREGTELPLGQARPACRTPEDFERVAARDALMSRARR